MFLCILCNLLPFVYMYYILRFLQHACSVIKFVILTIVCRSKSASELMLHCYVYSTVNKSSMSIYVPVTVTEVEVFHISIVRPISHIITQASS